MKCKGAYLRKRRWSTLWILKWQQTPNYQQLKLKNKYKNENKLSKQLEQEENHRYGDHVEGYQWGGGWGRKGGKVQGIKSIIGRYKLDEHVVSYVMFNHYSVHLN